MNLCGPTLGPSLEWRNAILSCAVLFSFLAIPTHGQDVAEAARQEKARKAAQQSQPPQTARHVYTDEDLKRKTILTPEDQVRVEARKQKESPAPAEQDAEQLPSNADPQAESLGGVARRFRRAQAVREAELAEKKKFTPFPYQVPADSLAEPKAGFDRSVSFESILPAGVRPAPPVRRYTVRPSVPATHGRVSPFQPRPLASIPSVPPAALLVLSGVSSSAPEPPPVAKVEKVLTVSPVSAGMQRVEVRRGQNWWKLAELYLGDGARWPELRKLNSTAGGSPEYLKSGSKVLMPEAARKNEPGNRTVTVKSGDTLWSLAQEHLGQGSAWTCLASANPQITDYTHIRVGTLVRLGEAEASASCQSRGYHQPKK